VTRYSSIVVGVRAITAATSVPSRGHRNHARALPGAAWRDPLPIAADPAPISHVDQPRRQKSDAVLQQLARIHIADAPLRRWSRHF
jgi:hypothetical protein